MRKQIEKGVNRVSAAAAVGALSVILLVDPALWVVALSLWLAATVILHLVGQSIATAMEQRLPSPPYHILVKNLDLTVSGNGLEGQDVAGCCDSATFSHGINV